MSPQLQRKSSLESASAAFRAHLPDLSTPRFTIAGKQDVYEYAKFFQDNHAPPWLFKLTEAWVNLYQEPFKGVTNDGKVRQGLFETKDEGVNIEHIVERSQDLFRVLDEKQRERLNYPINSNEWRAWSNPEILLRPLGLRLEEVPESTAEDILAILEASLSPEGYHKALSAMRINHFLGECVNLPRIMNKYSYNFLIFGTPSTSQSSPWGWLLYGHHLCISCFFRGPQVVISPTFTGAEPNIIDDGDWKGTEILQKEGNLGLKLMQSLSPEQQKRAKVFANLRDDGMTQTGDLITDRWNKDDQRSLCGAFRDNRIVPYEGILVESLTPNQLRLVLDIADEMLLYLPVESRRLRLDQIESHFHETYFCWIGGHGEDDAFYFRIQSPVVILEFDHHSGVFLSNTEPMKFHIHTIVRTPNAGDYGNAIREEDHQL